MRREVSILVAMVGLACTEDPDAVCNDVPLPDGPDDAATGPGERPELLEAEFVTPATLRLRFSEPLAPVDLVEPTRFRLSRTDIAPGYSYGYGPDEDPCDPLNTLYADPSGGGSRVLVDGLWAGEADELLLSLSIPVNLGDCRDVIDGDELGESAFLLHYTDDTSMTGGPRVEDVDGDRLAAIGEPWALDGVGCTLTSSYYGYTYYNCLGAYSVAGSVPNLDVWLPIPCPDFD
jgi:hypothetical protein